MRLEELLEMAFERGCGISMQEARALPRLAELEASLGDHSMPQEAAWVQLLGEQLIEAAFECLPDAMQMFAKVWPDMSGDEQLDTLRVMCDSLKSDMWYYHHKLEHPAEHKQTASDVLPREFGPWETGPVCPSCMGMGTLLMAFARRTGAPHLLAHVLKSIMFEVQNMDFETGYAIMEFLKGRLPELAKTGELDDVQERYGMVLDAIVRLNQYNFHPSMVIQIKDGRWVLADPYFGTVAVLDEPDWPMSEAVALLDKHEVPGSTVLVGSRKIVRKYRDQLVQESGFFGGFVESVMEQFEAADCEDPTLVDAVAILRALAEHESLSWLKPLLKDMSNEQLYGQGMFPGVEEVTSEMARRGIDLLRVDPQFSRLAVERLLWFVATLWIQRMIDDLEKMTRTAPHSSLELVQPANGIAVGTLNNLRCYHGSRPRKVGGVLVLFCRAQSIWHDAMLDVRGHKRVPPLIAETLARMEDALASEPPEFLHPYVARMIAARRTEGGAAWQLPRE